MDYTDIKEWFEAGKTAVDILKGARDLLPKGEKRDQVEAKIRAAEDILRRSDAKLAKELGYELCQCEFPPGIMLWRNSERSFVCTNEACGNRIKVHSPEDFPKRSTNWMV